MIKKIICILISSIIIVFLGGCWNYRGLNEMTIVAGISIDKNSSNSSYSICYEVIDLSSTVQSNAIKSKIIESEGETIFDAARNAKKKLDNKLYFGNAQVIIISNKIASQDGLNTIIDWFLRDSECRETVNVLISQEETAKEILTTEGIDQSVVSYEIGEIIDYDNYITASTKKIQLFNIYNVLAEDVLSLTLPAFHRISNVENSVSEANGIAVFKKDKLLGYLDVNESKYYLFVTNEIKGGLLLLPYPDEKNEIVLEISDNKTKKSYNYNNGKIKVLIETETSTFLSEHNQNINILDEANVIDIEDKAEKLLQKNIMDIISNTQKNFDSDIFGFGNMIYKKDPKLWRQLNTGWDHLFKTIEVEVRCKVTLKNSSFIK